MSYEDQVAEHYNHGTLINAIEEAIVKLGKFKSDITVEDLAPVDEFHIGGRIATDHLLNQVCFTDKDNLLDVGCGLGGAARYLAQKLGCTVAGVDLNQEYIDTGIELNKWLDLDNKVTLNQGSALALEFEPERFTGALMLHVGMNIEAKSKLFSEIFRVLKRNSTFAIYDIMRTADGELVYPVPWAKDQNTSMLASPEEYQQALQSAGFSVGEPSLRKDFALDFFKQMKAKTEKNGGPLPLGLYTLMQSSTPIKIGNMVNNISKGLIAPTEIIAHKP